MVLPVQLFMQKVRLTIKAVYVVVQAITGKHLCNRKNGFLIARYLVDLLTLTVLLYEGTLRGLLGDSIVYQA
jgi:hypothetical protein